MRFTLTMRRRVRVTIVMGLLLCALPTLEIPELLHLCDNTSNDFSTAVFQSKGPSVVRNEAPDVPEGETFVVAPLPFLPLAAQYRFYGSLGSSVDFLHLLCIQRT